VKIRDLLDEIERYKSTYGDAFLEWDIFVEQWDELGRHRNRWTWLMDRGGSRYIDCCGFASRFPKTGIFTINVNY